jgi:hypothetical protein
MADTVYTDGATLLTADTMNDLNRLHYTILGDPATGKAALTSLGNQASYAPWTTGGTDTAYTLTPTPASTANATGQRFRVTFNAASGATPTLAVSGHTAKNLKYYDSTGTKQAVTSTQVPINWISDVEYDGTDWVVLNVPPTAAATIGPAFSATSSSTQNPTTGVATKVVFGTEEYDTAGNFATSTFTPTTAGYYQISAGISMASDTSTTATKIHIYKNGSAYRTSEFTGLSSNGYETPSISALVYLNGSTDYVEIYGTIDGTGALLYFFTSSGAHSTFFSGVFIRG